jgi:phage terminase small subunit
MLSPKQLAFANHYLDGKTATEAHRLAYGGNPKDTTRWREAHSVLTNVKVQAYIEEKRKELSDRHQATREDKLKLLSGFMKAEDKPTTHRIKAIEVHNVMTGDNAPQEVNVFGLTELLTLVRKKA